MRKGFLVDHRPDLYISETVGANGTASGYIGPCPEGFQWYVERLTCYSNSTATTGLLEVYVLAGNQPPAEAFTKANRQDVAVGSSVLNDVSDQNHPIAVPPGHMLVAYWAGLNANDLVSLSCQVGVHKLDAVRAQHDAREMTWTGEEKLSHIVTPVVVGDQVAAV